MPSVQSLISLATLASRGAAQAAPALDTQTTCLALGSPDADDTNVVQTKIAVAPDDADGTTPYITGWFTAVYRNVDGTAITGATITGATITANLDFQLDISGISPATCTPTALSWNIHQEWTQANDWASGATDCGTGAGNSLGEALKSSASGEITTADEIETSADGTTVTISSGSGGSIDPETTISAAQDGKLNTDFPAFSEFETPAARSILFTVSCVEDDPLKDDVVFCARLFPSTVTAPAAPAPAPGN